MIARTQRGSFLDFGGWAVFLAVLYNTILSVVNAHVMPISNSRVAASEAVIVTACLVYIAFRIRVLPNIFPPLIFLLGAFIGFLIVSLANDTLFIKGIRDVLLIVTFFLMGGLINEKSLIWVFRILSWLVLVFMLVENYATELYVHIFEPALYYANTRGVAEAEYNELGIFAASLGYSGRFSFNISNHRLSSIFLEQVSLGNFSVILAIFLATFWERLKKFDRWFFFLLIPLMIMANDSRAGSILCLVTLLGFFIFPRIPRYVNVIYMPLLIMICYFFFYDPEIIFDKFTDDLTGRIGRTAYFLHEMDLSYFIGGGLDLINKTGDTGYSYIIYTFTIIGLIALWLFSSLTVPQETAGQKRYVHSANMFLFVSLLISGSVLSIKAAALLWVIAGFLYYQKYKEA